MIAKKDVGPSIKDRIADILDIPKEFAGDSALITITGNSDISVEGCRGIIEYTDTIIRLNTVKSMIKISGHNMELKEVTSEYIHIKGFIIGVEYVM